MPITLTVGDLLTAEQALKAVCALPLKSKEEPRGITPKVRYHLAKLARLVAAPTKAHAEDVQDMMDAHGITQGQPISAIDPIALKAYQQQMREAARKPVTLEWDAVTSIDLPLALASDLADLGPLCDLAEPPPGD